ncbi:MAG: cytochrome c peroxidase [Sedimenticolaceae bacterium]
MNPRKLDSVLLGLAVAFAFVFPCASTAVDFIDGGSENSEKVSLGQLLFFDKELSGNRNISCATCHHPLADTGDGLSLPVGEGGRGLGVMRDTGTGPEAIIERVPRNAPPIFALGSVDVTRMFWDGRIEEDLDFPSGFLSPAGDQLPHDLENIVAAQAMFPVTSPAEMAGAPGDVDVFGQLNEIAGPAEAADFTEIWERLAARLRSIPEYVELFKAAFPEEIDKDSDIRFSHAANAIAAFEISSWRADNTPFDRYERGERSALSLEAKRGMRLFFGKAGCDNCHSGNIFSDMAFHAIAMPQVGPGKGHGSGPEDWGRGPISGDPSDNFKFRTPPLRSVELTAPFGHSGAYNILEEVVRHHLDPVASLYAYDCEQQPVLPSRDDLDEEDCEVMNSGALVASIADANELPPKALKDRQVAEILAFLRALTDPDSVDLRIDVPKSVPSGLSIVE